MLIVVLGVQPARCRLRRRRVEIGWPKAFSAGGGDHAGRLRSGRRSDAALLPHAAARVGDFGHRHRAHGSHRHRGRLDRAVHRVRVERAWEGFPPLLDRFDPGHHRRRRLDRRHHDEHDRRGRFDAMGGAARTSEHLRHDAVDRDVRGRPPKDEQGERRGRSWRRKCARSQAHEERASAGRQWAQRRRHVYGGAEVPGQPRIVRRRTRRDRGHERLRHRRVSRL